jgi:hypothetical protein
MKEDKLKPCPFCGQEVDIGISDDEGNYRDEEYENDPWSGLSFTLIHEHEDSVECPIATHHQEILGSRLYESREEVTRAWNKRSELR